jgi:polyhydroxybutyrate depolymerase
MLLRQLAVVGFVSALVPALGASLLVGCDAGGNRGTSGGGTTGSAGMGSAGATSPTAGTTGSAAGTTGGAAGTTGGAAGTTGGAAGTTGGGAGSTGTGGTVATGGTTGGGSRPSGPSAGCMKAPPDEAIGSAVSHNIDITGMAEKYVAGYAKRTYCSTIPKNYNPTQPYPVVVFGPGCGGLTCEGNGFSGRSDLFMIQATKAPAVYNGLVKPVPPEAAPGCFQTGVVSTVDSPELNYFDQVIAEVESKYCIDKGRIFVAGTSSGGWFTNYLACARGNVIRGAAADSGGIPFDRPACTGGAAVMEFPGDSAVKKDSMGREIGMALARDLFIKTNGCSTTATQMKFGADTCDFYGGCDSPIAWCNTGGGHQAGNGHLAPTGWAFWSTLK